MLGELLRSRLFAHHRQRSAQCILSPLSTSELDEQEIHRCLGLLQHSWLHGHFGRRTEPGETTVFSHDDATGAVVDGIETLHEAG